ncbi:hypothetical protein AMS68_000723 [Peltaster fructicola]|uniref:Uncharacterized protein n=1 Tax=Peltaster fructicola TaxID=286661 RepID=A0A6H0XKH5_9PEZI|nr:hypothetical protein AMS68_000723 [Peltaster fructicola]
MLFQSPANPESDQAWFSLMPPGKGFVQVEDAGRFNLKPGLSISAHSSGDMYNIAAFHQLDCLSSIREYLWHLKFAVDTNKTEQLRPILLDPQEDHILSCFDYLRQSIMCAGDTTLEWPAEDSHGRQATVDGWGVPHHCVDWNALLEQTQQDVLPV